MCVGLFFNILNLFILLIIIFSYTCHTSRHQLLAGLIVFRIFVVDVVLLRFQLLQILVVHFVELFALESILLINYLIHLVSCIICGRLRLSALEFGASVVYQARNGTLDDGSNLNWISRCILINRIIFIIITTSPVSNRWKSRSLIFTSLSLLCQIPQILCMI